MGEEGAELEESGKDCRWCSKGEEVPGVLWRVWIWGGSSLKVPYHRSLLSFANLKHFWCCTNRVMGDCYDRKCNDG